MKIFLGCICWLIFFIIKILFISMNIFFIVFDLNFLKCIIVIVLKVIMVEKVIL